MNHQYFKKTLAEVIASDYQYLKGQTFPTQFGDLIIDEIRVVEVNTLEYDIILISDADIPFREIYEVLNKTSFRLVDFLKLNHKEIMPINEDRYIEIDFHQIYYSSLKNAEKVCKSFSHLVADRCKFKPYGSMNYHLIDYIKPLKIAPDKFQVVVVSDIKNKQVLDSNQLLTQDIVIQLSTCGIQQNKEPSLKDFIELYL